MPRKFFKKYLPDPVSLREHRHLRFFGARLADPNLWHLNRRCVANGALIGFVCALLPIPFQMLPAALLAIFFRANLPISIFLVWLTNPLTAVPVWYGTYWLGAIMLGMQPSWEVDEASFEAMWNSMWANFGQIYIPLLVGSLVVGVTLGALAWVGVHYAWHANVRHHWEQRRARRQARQQKQDDT
ncbi:MAG: DUF2062 domain-containing protein [Pseudomonadota bacterium]